MDGIASGSTLEVTVSLEICGSDGIGTVDWEERFGSNSSTSFFVILPPGPDPDMLEMFMPSSSAMRRAIGVANIRPPEGALLTSAG